MNYKLFIVTHIEEDYETSIEVQLGNPLFMDNDTVNEQILRQAGAFPLSTTWRITHWTAERVCGFDANGDKFCELRRTFK